MSTHRHTLIRLLGSPTSGPIFWARGLRNLPYSSGLAVLLLAALVAMIGGCSGVAIFTDPSMSKQSETGVPFYMPKPYLLLTRTNKKDEPISVEVVYLPDTANPRFARQRRGMGSTTLTLKLSNGVLTEFGQTTDSKVPETITAAAGGLKSIAEALKVQRERELLKPQSADPAEIKAAGVKLQVMAGEMKAEVANYQSVSSADAASAFEKVADSFALEAAKLQGPGAIALLRQALKNIATASERLGELRLPAGYPPADAINTRIDSWLKTTAKIAEDFAEKPAPQPIIELYEIEQGSGGTKLTRVLLPGA